MIIINSATTTITGPAPWTVGKFTVGANPELLYAYNLSKGDKICLVRVLTGSDETGFTQNACTTVAPIPGSVVATSDVSICGTYQCLEIGNESVLVSEPGSYELRAEGPGFPAGTVIIERQTWIGDHSPQQCQEPVDIASMPDLVVAELPDLVVAELPDLVVAELPDLVVAELPDLVVAELPDLVVAELPDLVIKEIPELKIEKHVVSAEQVCGELWYIWSDGTKTTEVLPACPAPIVYCPSLRLSCDGQPGYGYHIDDPKDPAATVKMAPCPTDTTADAVYIYPTAGPGHTIKILDCNGVLIGYAVNRSDCAPEYADCGCS